MSTLEIVDKVIYCVFMAFGIGLIAISIYELVKEIRSFCSKKPKEKYSVFEYENAELVLQRYKDRALEIYKALDRKRKLMGDEADYFSFSLVPFNFKDSDKPELMAVLMFGGEDEEEDYSNISREAWFPFDLFNMKPEEYKEKIDITWDKKNYIYGGGGCWKMVARFKKED